MKNHIEMLKSITILGSLLLAFSFGCTQVEEKTAGQYTPEELLVKINDPSRYITTYQIAERIIGEDPSVYLIDVRMEDEYDAYAIPGSLSLPLEELLSPDNDEYLRQEGMDIIFYSNGDVFADQAWMLAVQKGIQDVYVLQGGLNEWFRTIIKPEAPPETASQEAFDLYSFARGACIYFGGNSMISTDAGNVPKRDVVVRQKKKKAAEGGC
jgi:rhodanese-related sulfurtransferase